MRRIGHKTKNNEQTVQYEKSNTELKGLLKNQTYQTIRDTKITKSEDKL